MILGKALLLKGLGGVTALGATATAAYFVFSNNDSDAKALKKDLGIPSDCKLPTSNNSPANCTLDADKLKVIKFDGKTDTTSSITVTGTLNLKITKTSDTNTYPKGYKFTFENENDLSIPKTSSSDVISIKKGTNTEFKIKETPSTTDGGAKTLSLEKAWSALDLAKKIGISSCDTSNKECTFSDNATLNLFISSSDTKENVTITGNNKKIKYEEDAAEHNQGFKFTADSEICLTSGTETKKIEASSGANSPSYEIKEIDGQWYLAKKTTNGVSG